MGVLFSWRQRAPRAPLAAQPRTDEDVRQLLSLLPRYRVLLYDDNVHDMDYVVRALLHTIPTLSEREATRVMLGAHVNGVSEVLVCPKELAEHYRDCLAGYGLGCSIEPA